MLAIFFLYTNAFVVIRQLHPHCVTNRSIQAIRPSHRCFMKNLSGFFHLTSSLIPRSSILISHFIHRKKKQHAAVGFMSLTPKLQMDVCKNLTEGLDTQTESCLLGVRSANRLGWTLLTTGRQTFKNQ